MTGVRAAGYGLPAAGSGLRTAALALCAGLCLASPAAADLVHLKNGRTLSVESWTLDGATVVLVFRDGGRMEAPVSSIEEVLPDEYPRISEAAPPLATIAPLTEAGASALQPLVDRLAARYGVDVRLARAVVRVESNYQPRAVSPKGAMGLMQLMPSVARQYEVANPFDPVENLDAGLRHLRGLLDRFKNDVGIALAAYNAGLLAVARYGGIPPFRETQDYVRHILALAR